MEEYESKRYRRVQSEVRKGFEKTLGIKCNTDTRRIVTIYVCYNGNSE